MWPLLFAGLLISIGTACVLITEGLSVFHLLTPLPVVLSWCMALAMAAIALRRFPMTWPKLTALDGLLGAVLALIAGPIAVTAYFAPPNSTDAMAYHMPRIVYWLQARSVEFFPTPYLPQIMLQPTAEYLMLHTWLLSGGDGFVNFVQFSGMLGSVAAVAAITRLLGGDRLQQWNAAIFCATLPNGVLQASGAKNDYVLTLWIAGSVAFLLRWMSERRLIYLVFSALAAALALNTKGTAYLFLPPMLFAAGLTRVRSSRQDLVRILPLFAVAVLLICGPQFARNIDLSGYPLGFDSSHADGQFRFRNERFGWKVTTSNFLRHVSEQLGSRSERLNSLVYNSVLSVHASLGIDPQDPDTTWRWTRFERPRNANHEVNANNRWHLLILLVAIGVAALRCQINLLLYAAGPAVAFLLFCSYLKWQTFAARLELPLFVMCAPLAGLLIGSLRPKPLPFLMIFYLLSLARLPLTQNWTRPLNGENSVLRKPREEMYVSDLATFGNLDKYRPAAIYVAERSCGLIGIDINTDTMEYPFQAMVMSRRPGVRFMHTAVLNPSAKYRKDSSEPCAVFCADCVTWPGTFERYKDFGTLKIFGTAVVWLRHSEGSARQ